MIGAEAIEGAIQRSCKAAGHEDVNEWDKFDDWDDWDNWDNNK